jgi:hypothetical protein
VQSLRFHVLAISLAERLVQPICSQFEPLVFIDKTLFMLLILEIVIRHLLQFRLILDVDHLLLLDLMCEQADSILKLLDLLRVFTVFFNDFHDLFPSFFYVSLVQDHFKLRSGLS